jgi:hypothetical protein
MNLLSLIIAGLVIGSASGAALAAEFSPVQGKILEPDAGPQQGCGDCPPEDGNESSEQEQNKSRPERPPSGSEAPPTKGNHSDAPELAREAPDCSSWVELRSNGSFIRTAVGGVTSGDTSWEFPVACGGSQVTISLKLSGLSGTAYLDFDNQMDVLDGNGTKMDSYRSGVNVNVFADHAMYTFDNEGQGEAGMWLFDITECGLIGDYELVIRIN